MIDVTESRLAEQTLRRTEKLAAAGRLAATVAHEVNNPLEALVNLVYLAQRVEGLPEEASAHLRIADEELGRIAHIVRQTLGFYRETASPRVTALGSLVSSVLDLYRSRAASRGIHLVDETAHEGEIKVMVNAGEIKQVVANLVSNAIDATPEEGTVRISLRKSAGHVEVVVADTGSGISKESRKRLFEPFFTTKLDVGTGLGLWVSKGITEKHGGSIVVDPPVEDGVGTTMRIVLPLL
jgi:signal transduction histidine kinase